MNNPELVSDSIQSELGPGTSSSGSGASLYMRHSADSAFGNPRREDLGERFARRSVDPSVGDAGRMYIGWIHLSLARSASPVAGRTLGTATRYVTVSRNGADNGLTCATSGIVAVNKAIGIPPLFNVDDTDDDNHYVVAIITNPPFLFLYREGKLMYRKGRTMSHASAMNFFFTASTTFFSF